MRNISRLISSVVIVALLSSLVACGIPQDKYDELQKNADSLALEVDTLQTQVKKLDEENKELLSKINDLRFGAKTLIAEAKVFFENNDHLKALETIKQLVAFHPFAAEVVEAKELEAKINLIISIFYNRSILFIFYFISISLLFLPMQA